MLLEVDMGLILAKSVCSGKFRFRSFGPKSGKKYLFSIAYISVKPKSVLIFGKFEGSSLENVNDKFLSSPLLQAKNGDRKSGLEFLTFVQSAQSIEVHEGLLWQKPHINYQGDYLFPTEVFTRK